MWGVNSGCGEGEEQKLGGAMTTFPPNQQKKEKKNEKKEKLGRKILFVRQMEERPWQKENRTICPRRSCSKRSKR